MASVHYYRTLLGGLLLPVVVVLFLAAKPVFSKQGEGVTTPITSTTPITTTGFYDFHGTNPDTYSRPGDITIGALIKTADRRLEVCDQNTKLSPIVLEQTEAVAFAVDYVNSRPDLLPNVTLGFVVKGICNYLGQAIASSLLFVPRTKKNSDELDEERSCDCGSDNIVNDTERSTMSSSSSSSVPSSSSSSSSSSEKEKEGYLGHHDVIGVMSMGWSSFTVSVSSVYAVAKVPLVGPVETNDELSNKQDHPYFFRMSAPQRYQVEAILKFIYDNGWSYISVLYYDCSYSLTTVTDMVEQYGICIATMHRVTRDSNFDEVVSDLLLHSRARVVVVFIAQAYFGEILRAVGNRNAMGHFIWIGGNLINNYRGIAEEEQIRKDPGIGTFYFDTSFADVPELFSHLENLNPLTSRSPWLKELWEYILDCSLENGTCAKDASILESSRYRTYKGTSLRIDAILSLAHAAHNLLSDRCPHSRGQEARACITGELLLQYMKNVSFEGFVGPVRFDENQDVKGRYDIKQIVYDTPSYPYLKYNTDVKKQILGKKIGFYDISTATIEYFDTLDWGHLKTLERVVPWVEGQRPVEVPESVCSRPCVEGEYKIEKNVPCCWDCRRCRENERLVSGNTSCEACPPFTWPDPATGLTTCEDLPLTYSTFEDTVPMVLTAVAVLALIVTLGVCTAYTTYRNERVIKASSRELSLIQLAAIVVGYSTVILFQTAPSQAMCRAIFVLFCMSFALLYCPLLAKTSRIFRIFRSGTKNERPRFISPTSQLVLSASLIAVQVVLCITTFVLYTPGAQRIQPIWTEKLVELSCDLTLPGLASFLGYNVFLVSVCSVFAFLTRSLPDNFNESKFITMCVSTTLLIWLAFIPTYFTAGRQFVRVFLLSVALLLNHSVALIFLFVPKIYAAVFLTTDTGDFSKNRS